MTVEANTELKTLRVVQKNVVVVVVGETETGTDMGTDMETETVIAAVTAVTVGKDRTIRCVSTCRKEDVTEEIRAVSLMTATGIEAVTVTVTGMVTGIIVTIGTKFDFSGGGNYRFICV
eukprot:Lithocolla_globosa_v1_NODE_7691_length_913_cov_15.928904.p4 type:complete len:119 gc:universal NODE_7691_length_913_cov_15.928904:576-220(-)